MPARDASYDYQNDADSYNYNDDEEYYNYDTGSNGSNEDIFDASGKKDEWGKWWGTLTPRSRVEYEARRRINIDAMERKERRRKTEEWGMGRTLSLVRF